MAPSPIDNSSGPLGIRIKAGGNEISETILISSVRVENELNRIPRAIVTMADGDVASGTFPLTDGDDFSPGTEVEISAFFGSNTGELLFSGIITATMLRATAQGGTELALTCRDKAIKLADIRKTATRTQVKDSDAMTSLISDAGLTADVAATTADATDLVQYDCSDWDFLRLLADRNGHVLHIDGGKITSKEPDATSAASATVTLGVDLIEIYTSIKSNALSKDIKVISWAPTDQATSIETTDVTMPSGWGNANYSDLSKVTGDRSWTMTTPYSAGQLDPRITAKSRAARVGLSAMEGACRYQGSTLAGPGDTIEIKTFGDRMSGTALVSGISHDISAGSWVTTAQLGLPSDWRSDTFGISAPGAGGLGSPIKGLHVATIVSLVDDDGSNPFSDTTMIKISLPLVGETPAEIWARYAAPHATTGAGIQFLPEVGDEVIVGFLSADPGAPVILGSLHSGKNTRQNDPTTDNYIKTLQTKSGLNITFDDEKAILTAKTPGGHSIVQDDDAKSVTITDLTGNKIEMTSSGVSITSTGTLDIKAAGKITISSDADAAISANNIEASANLQMTAKGGSAAEFSASGQTTVKGAMVMIN